MRANQGDFVGLPGIPSWVYVTDAAEEPESIIIGLEAELVRFIVDKEDSSVQAAFRLTDVQHITDNSLIQFLNTPEDKYPFVLVD